MQALSRRGLAEWLITACGVWLIGLGLFFMFVRPPLLPEDARYLGTDLQTLQAAAPHLADWLGKVFTVMGGFMTGTGVLVALFGWVAMPTRPRWTPLVLLLVGASTVALMSSVNFTLHSDFRWLLAAPPLAWVAAVVFCVVQGRRRGSA